MTDIELARSLRRAGVHWSPVKGDRFMVPDRDLDDEVFVVSDMVVEAMDVPNAGGILAFNGTTEWALDSLEAAEAIWLPREDQLRGLLGDAFVSLERLDTEPVGYAVTVRVWRRRRPGAARRRGCRGRAWPGPCSTCSTRRTGSQPEGAVDRVARRAQALADLPGHVGATLPELVGAVVVHPHLGTDRPRAPTTAPVWSKTGAPTARMPGVRSASEPAQPRPPGDGELVAQPVRIGDVRAVTASIGRASHGLLPAPGQHGQDGLARARRAATGSASPMSV